MSHARKLFTGGVILLLLLTLAPIASAQHGSAPVFQATETPVATVAATDTPAATSTVAPTTAAGTAEATPATLPETGASADGNTPNASIPFMLVLIGALIVVAGAAVAMSRRPR